MNKFITIFTFIFVSSIIYSQQTTNRKIDSLKLEFNRTTQDTSKIQLLLALAEIHLYTDPKTTYNYLQESIKKSKEINYSHGIGLSYLKLGIHYSLKSDFTNALAVDFKALNIFEKANNNFYKSLIYNNIATVYGNSKNYNKSLLYLNKALLIAEKTNDSVGVTIRLNNIGDIYLQKKEFKKASQYFIRALKKNIQLNNRFGQAINLTNLGIAFINLKSYSKGIEYINSSMKIHGSKTDFYNTYNIHELGRVHYLMALQERNPKTKKNHLLQSDEYLKVAIQQFKRLEVLNEAQESYLFLSKTNKELSNYKEALQYFKKYVAIKTSIFSKETHIKIANIEAEREIGLRDKKIEIQNLKIKSEARKVYLLFTSTGAVLLLLGLFFWLYISKRKANSQLNDKNKIISNINKQKDKFFSIIAHDLRGPFNGFLGLTELLAEEIDAMEKEEIQFAATTMRSSAKNLNSLLENLLEWSRMEQGLIPFEPQENILLPVVNECIATLEAAANKKEIKIQTHITEEINVFADNNILHAVIRNFLSNAVKFTPKGGTIRIQGKENDQNTTISIKDSGIGMNSKILDNLFRLDVQTNRKGTEDEPSTGLGLILCKEFVEKHGGKIWVESEEGKGSTFYFSFPKNTPFFKI
jgi:signal transduction histidine kinase